MKEGTINRVTDGDLQIAVNGLWAAGAEAGSINGQRLSATSAIRTAGSAVLSSDFRPLSPPYEITALGDPEALQAGVEAAESGDYLAELSTRFGIRTSWTGGAELQRPRPVRSARCARPPRSIPPTQQTARPRRTMPGRTPNEGLRIIAIIGLIVGVVLGIVVEPRPGRAAALSPDRGGRRAGQLAGGLRASLDGAFDAHVFITSFLFNVVIAAFLVFLGDQLGVGAQLSTAVIVVLGIRIFSNAAAIRRLLFRSWSHGTRIPESPEQQKAVWHRLRDTLRPQATWSQLIVDRCACCWTRDRRPTAADGRLARGASQQELVRLLDESGWHAAGLELENAELDRTLESLRSGQGDDAEARSAAEERLTNLEIIAGTSPAHGRGIVVSIADPRGCAPPRSWASSRSCATPGPR